LYLAAITIQRPGLRSLATAKTEEGENMVSMDGTGKTHGKQAKHQTPVKPTTEEF
jgi:hypothetical protein